MSVRTRFRIVRWLGVGWTFASLACGEPAAEPLHTITFVAHADPGEALAGVQIATTFQGQPHPFGTTGEDGVLVQRLRAPYGTVIPLTATCPPGHRQAETVPSIRLDPIRTLDPVAAARGIEITIQCLPLEREAVLIVRATGTPMVANIPVLVDGRDVARTDEGGVAHVALREAPNTSFRVELAAAVVSPFLSPARPAHDFTLPDEDTYITFEQAFSFAPPPPVRPRRPRPRPTAPPPPSGPRRPVRIGGPSR